MNAANLRPRSARGADIPFLAAMADAAVGAPHPRSFWAILGEPISRTGPAVVEALLRHGAFRWGQLADFLVLEEAGAPVASCAVFSAAASSAWPADPDGMAPALAADGVDPEHAEACAARFRAMFTGIERSPFAVAPAAAIVENVGVAPERRGIRLVEPLFEAAYARARELGFMELGLSVVLDNVAARRAYQRLGFETIGEYGPEHFGAAGFPGLAKMRRSFYSPAPPDGNAPTHQG